MAEHPNNITIRPCGKSPSRWVVDDVKRIIHFQSLNCLTAVSTQLIMDYCNNRPNQKWQIEFENINPDIKAAFPQLTLDELRERRMELQSGDEETTIKDVDEFFAWGTLKIQKRDQSV